MQRCDGTAAMVPPIGVTIMLTLDQIKTMKPAEILALLAAQQAALDAKMALRLKVSDKKAVSIYGLNKQFPVTLYAPQMLRLLDMADDIRKFIEDNRANLSWDKADNAKTTT